MRPKNIIDINIFQNDLKIDKKNDKKEVIN